VDGSFAASLFMDCGSVAFGALGFNRRLPKTLASLVWEALFGCIEPCPITCGLCGSKTIRYV
jgi:hypothetical protein